ncbi:FKBP-type peptidyl-prolyl cis-trans isomerase [Haloglycomyces albus]|uniref:FKBP-type peptidyl-prolyl cis-trans isomerase n=1 Tax=Haloglycomyces albus TaxID=526067 RepID=UPI00046C9754|nr:FKBP-type peptidyl-prolyl cis-trans isomerase [Haloglycomyces albus]
MTASQNKKNAIQNRMSEKRAELARIAEENQKKEKRRSVLIFTGVGAGVFLLLGLIVYGGYQVATHDPSSDWTAEDGESEMESDSDPGSEMDNQPETVPSEPIKFDDTGFDVAGDCTVDIANVDDTHPEIQVQPDCDPPEELVSETLVEGDGEPIKAGDTVTADYVGVNWDDSEVFDSSWDRGEALPINNIGGGQVIEGWDKGLIGAKPGEVLTLVIPSDMAYGEGTLVFTISIVSVESPEQG